MTTVQKLSVWVWLPTEAHGQLVSVAVGEGVSLPVLARRAAAHAMAAVDGRVSMPAPTGEAVQELRAAGYELNRLLPALDGATTRVQEAAIATRLGAVLDRVAAASDGVRLCVSHKAAEPVVVHGDGDGVQRWRLVRVTTDPDTATWWAHAAVAEFRSMANWVRDALTGTHGLAVAATGGGDNPGPHRGRAGRPPRP